jgi:hypothetical protein
MKISYSADAREALNGFSEPGRAHIIQALLEGLAESPASGGGHLHAGGMCVLFERNQSTVDVKYLSPQCARPERPSF